MREFRVQDSIVWWAIGGMALGAVIVTSCAIDWLDLGSPVSWVVAAVVAATWVACAVRRRRGYLRITESFVALARLRVRTIPFVEMRRIARGGNRSGGLAIYGTSRARIFVNEDYLASAGSGWGALLVERADAFDVPVDPWVRARIIGIAEHGND